MSQTQLASSLWAEAAPTAAPIMEVTAVIPCLNEERTIGMCIEKALGAFRALGIRGEVVVADNGSSDRSIEMARACGARIVVETTKGYGAALNAGIRAAAGEIVIMADADDSYDWSAIGPFIAKIREGNDVVIGNRFRGGIVDGAMPFLHRYLGNPVLSFIARTAFRIDIGDFHCGMRAFTRGAYERMKIRTTGMEFATEMIANAAVQQLRIAEIPTRLYPDKRNRPPHLRSFRDGWRHLRFILTYAPDHLYLGPGAGMFVAGLALLGVLAAGPLQIGRLYMGIHFLALGSLLTLLGFNVVQIGVLAKVIIGRRYEGIQSRVVNWVSRHFRLETGLGAGLLLAAAGGAIDLAIAFQWIRHFGSPMEGTVHLAFVATTVIVLGANIFFGSFLFALLGADQPAAPKAGITPLRREPNP